MSERAAPVRIAVCAAAQLAENRTAKFRFGRGNAAGEGFVIRRGGRLYAYRNRCRHIPMTMDWVENRFLSRDGCWIQCATHGALYEIETGLCVAGPPAGERLEALEVVVEGDTIVVVVRSEDTPARSTDRPRT